MGIDVGNLDQLIDQTFEPVATALDKVVFYTVPVTGYDVKLILLWLVAAALFFTIYLGFVNIRYFRHGISLLRDKDKTSEQAGSGEISRFQVLSTALSGTVGLGNIAGVAVAISVGGPGAAFWMAVMGLLGMSTKFAEAALGVKYRIYPNPKNKNHVLGGPMYYIKDAFKRHDQKLFGKFLAGFFAVCVIGGAFGAGNMFQANQSFRQFVHITGGEAGFMADKGWLYGIILAILVGGAIIGGLKSIAAVASKIVPLMGITYIVAGLVVIAINYQNIPSGFVLIIQEALAPEAGLGALLGGLLVGVQRAAFSNEAGIGSACIVHSTAKTDIPVTQGFVAMLEPFIDTIIICMVTALVIVMSGTYVDGQGVEGVTLTSRAFESVIPWFPYILTFTVFLFAYSTMIAWSYYGLRGVTYLTGENKYIELSYKIIFCLFVIVGSASSLNNIIVFSDAMIFCMAVPNIIGLYLLAPELKRDVKKYLQDIKK